MLKTRIIPTLLWKNLGLVKGVAFQSWRRVGTVLPAIKVYNTRDVDELFLLDIEANSDFYDPDFESISDYSKHCFVPFSVGGGIKKIDQIRISHSELQPEHTYYEYLHAHKNDFCLAV